MKDHKITGVKFRNDLDDTGKVNFLSHTFIYNGAGVAVGDINNDGLDDIFFSGNMRSSELYLNKGNLHFENITEKAGVNDGKDHWATGVNMVDINSDGWLDIYVCYTNRDEPSKRKNRFYINQKNGKFKDEAQKYGLDDASYSVQAVFFDFDRDNDLDMYLLNYNSDHISSTNWEYVKHTRDLYAGDKLFENRDGKFHDISNKAGIKGSPLGYGLGVAVADINGDNYPDLYISNDFVEPDYLYINNGNGTFSDQLPQYFQHISQFSMGSDLSDYNNDGAVDLLTIDMLPEDNKRQKLLYGPENYEAYARQVLNGYYHQSMRNMLHLNNSNGTFSEIGQLAGVSNTDWSWSALLADYDNDGWKDLFITNGYYKDVTNKDFLKFKGDYYFEQQIKGEEPDTTYIVKNTVSTPISNYIYRNEGDLRFKDMSKCWGISDLPGFSNGAAYSDLDMDGDLDLVINNVNGFASIYENRSNVVYPNRNFIKLDLKGSKGNLGAYNSKINIFSQNGNQFYEKMPVRGFQSAMSPLIHIGLGEINQIDSVVIDWDPTRKSIIKNPKLNTTIVIDKQESEIRSTRNKTNQDPVLLGKKDIINHQHKEYPINDFKRQRLLLTMPSNSGPVIKTADLNSDGLEDVIIGSSKGSYTEIYYQKEDGTFLIKKLDSTFNHGTTTSLELADFNGDGLLDIYEGNGGYHDYTPRDKNLQDRLYLNVESRFKFQNNLPVMTISTGSVTSSDFDNDGDLDLYVGARIVPGMYPLTPPSYLLCNDGHGNFTDCTENLAPSFEDLGMITSSSSFDFDKDGWDDLILAGEYMPITFYQNQSGKGFKNVTAEVFQSGFTGLWSAIEKADYDNDGDIDLVLGNFGLNSQLKASVKEPLSIYFGDFNKDGAIDPIVTSFIQGKKYPFASRDAITNQMISLRRKFPTYEKFSEAILEEVLDENQLGQASILTAVNLTSVYLENVSGRFILRNLPLEAQFAPIQCIFTTDINDDGYLDILTGGNQSFIRIRLGAIDASYGQVFLGDGKGNFRLLPQKDSGLKLKGDVKSIDTLKVGNKEYYLFGMNNAPLETYLKKQ
ncbi:VCBS repeat-containing protein [Galbibacter sp. BG1]|uniref:VCBS repeat-containing protein n=1 Tax=Galbibacter sp. BG1 TaxID=1170699 RepID=UPI001C7007FE|nr:VCBS repeat-containing protein [Galbibacter sp. BG1]